MMVAMRMLLCCLLLLTLTSPLWAQTKEVARVDSIEGSKGLSMKKGDKGAWTTALVNTMAAVGDHLKTDAKTEATLEFLLGGRANLDTGTEIAILNSKDAKVVAQTVQLNSGSIWAQFDKQKSPVQIQTAGGVMGIRGTEFVVSVDPQGETELSLIEGEVEVTDAQGQTSIVRPGQRVRFGLLKRMATQDYTPEELLQRLQEERPGLFRHRKKLRRAIRAINEEREKEGLEPLRRRNRPRGDGDRP